MGKNKCPVCLRQLGKKGVFKCRGCGKWTHPECGGYASYSNLKEVQSAEDSTLYCNICNNSDSNGSPPTKVSNL